jgi:hypothetical protein
VAELALESAGGRSARAILSGRTAGTAGKYGVQRTDRKIGKARHQRVFPRKSTKMWEKVVAIGTVVLIILTSILVWQGFNRPAINWPLLGTVAIVALAFVIAAILNFKAANRQLPRTGANRENSELERHVWFFSPGICVSLNRSVGSVIVNLQILSKEQTELIYIRVDLRDSTGKIAITCEHSEPIMIDRLVPAAKMIERDGVSVDRHWPINLRPLRSGIFGN